MATSHGEGGGAGGAGGALPAISATSAEVLRPATISNRKATRFITSPFFIPCRQTGGFDASTCKLSYDDLRSPDVRLWNFVNFSMFATEQPRLNREQMLPFYAFVGKLHTLSRSVAVGIQLICERFLSVRTLRQPLYKFHPRRKADEGDGGWRSD